MDTLLRKSDIRIAMKKLMSQYSSDDLNTFSLKICRRSAQMIDTKKIRNIAVFAPSKYEPNIWPVIRELWQNNAQTYFPKVNANKKSLDFFQVEKEADLMPGTFGMLEPRTGLRALEVSSLEVIVVPGLAFDREGNRLGRSKGYYDKFLARLPNTVTKIGVCFPFQLIDKVPVENWDVKVESVISG